MLVVSCLTKAWVSRSSSRRSLQMWQCSDRSGQRGRIVTSASYAVLLWHSFGDRWAAKSIRACEGCRPGMAGWGPRLWRYYSRDGALTLAWAGWPQGTRATGASVEPGAAVAAQEAWSRRNQTHAMLFLWPVLLKLWNSHLEVHLGRLELLMCVARGMSERQTSASSVFCLFYNSAWNFGALWCMAIAGRNKSFCHDNLNFF